VNPSAFSNTAKPSGASESVTRIFIYFTRCVRLFKVED
jgi:hypothetical protein